MGNRALLRAQTFAELKNKAFRWEYDMCRKGLTDIRAGWDLERAKHAEDGCYEILMWAHT